MEKKRKTRTILVFTLIIIISFFAYFGISKIITENQNNITKTFKTVPIFQAWTEVENLSNLNYTQQLAKHDLVFNSPYSLLQISWDESPEEPYEGLITSLDQYALETAQEIRHELKVLNPDIKLIVSLLYREGPYLSSEYEGEFWWERGFLPPDSPYWLKNSTGGKIIGWGEDTNLDGKIDEQDEILTYLINFTDPQFQDLVSEKAKTLKDSGLFDGVMLDWMNENPTTDDASISGWEPLLNAEEELAARISIITKIREKAGEDFIIMGNTNYNEFPTLAPLLDCVFMECYKESYDQGYSDEILQYIQSAVKFNQENLDDPKLVCLEGWRVCDEYDPDLSTRITERNSDENLQWMRFFTTMSLTLTDGYVLFGDDNAIPYWDHAHNWYDFWDAPIGDTVSSYQMLYHEIPNLYIREFENAWVIYNFSGEEQEISFDSNLTSVFGSSYSNHFILQNRDGNIFLKT